MKMPHLFERATFEHVEAFTAPTTANDDGIAATAAHWSQFSSGSVIAVHGDRHVSVIDWRQIVNASCSPHTENCRMVGRFRGLRQPEEIEDRPFCTSIFVLHVGMPVAN
jgi:hypothetical protein